MIHGSIFTKIGKDISEVFGYLLIKNIKIMVFKVF